MKCTTCKHYTYYLWIYTNGNRRIVDSCKLHIHQNKETCKKYEKKENT